MRTGERTERTVWVEFTNGDLDLVALCLDTAELSWMPDRKLKRITELGRALRRVQRGERIESG